MYKSTLRMRQQNEYALLTPCLQECNVFLKNKTDGPVELVLLFFKG